MRCFIGLILGVVVSPYLFLINPVLALVAVLIGVVMFIFYPID